MDDPPEGHEDHPAITTRNSRYGLILFALYLLLYGGFMYLAAIWGWREFTHR